MINFRYIKHAYYTPFYDAVANFSKVAKLDTGAALSVLGAASVCSKIDVLLFCDKVKQRAAELQVEQKYLTAANGSQFEIIPCRLQNVYLDRTLIQEFKFGLYLNPNSNTFLLGDDFLSCCEFNHTIGGPIQITDFSVDRYKQKNNNVAVNLSDIYNQFDSEQVISKIDCFN